MSRKYACGIISDGIEARDWFRLTQHAAEAACFETHEGSEIARHHLHRIEWALVYGANARVRPVISVPIEPLIGIAALSELWVGALFGETVEIGDSCAQPSRVNACSANCSSDSPRIKYPERRKARNGAGAAGAAPKGRRGRRFANEAVSYHDFVP
jgi:hypothetical protein